MCVFKGKDTVKDTEQMGRQRDRQNTRHTRQTEKRDNETGSFAQTSQLDIKGKEDRGYVCPLRGKK